MFTVIIAEPPQLEAISDYQRFLEPLLNKDRVAFCPWYPDQRDICKAVPDLPDLVSERERWQVLILCGNQGIDRKNPFDLITCTPPPREDDESQEDYLSRCTADKLSAYRRSAEQPLTRLTAALCPHPEVVSDDLTSAGQDPAFAAYCAEQAERVRLWNEVTEHMPDRFFLPNQVICLSPRTIDRPGADSRAAWTVYDENAYSEFCDRNLYSDTVRFLVFDMVEENHRSYHFDRLRLLYVALLLANYPVPRGSMRPNRVYRLQCDTDRHRLEDLLSLYESKLLRTEQYLASEAATIRAGSPKRLSDQAVSSLFCGKCSVPVTMPEEFSRKDLQVSKKGYGLSSDCPEDEHARWSAERSAAIRSMREGFKYPRRSLRRSVEQLHALDRISDERIGWLTDTQVEDVRSHLEREELDMISAQTQCAIDTDAYEKQMSKAAEQVAAELNQRMSRRTTVILGTVVLGCYGVGLVPLFVSNYGMVSQRLSAFVLALGAAGGLAAALILVLFLLRRRLTERIALFNHTLHEICKTMDRDMARQSDYLSRICAVRRGFSVLNERAKYQSPEDAACRILDKHRADVRRQREELHTVFGPYLPQKAARYSQQIPYDYDFTSPRDYIYPIPFEECPRSRVEFIQEGSYVELPGCFMTRITIRREELYD